MDRVARRDFLSAVGALLTLPLAAEAQQTARLPRIGVEIRHAASALLVNILASHKKQMPDFLALSGTDFG